MRILKYILNSPISLLLLLHLVFCFPTRAEIRKDALVFWVRTCGLVHLYAKHVRGFAAGNIVMVKIGESEKIVAHELVHVEQFMRRPLVQLLLYLYELRKGYWNNAFEIEAYNRTDTWPEKPHIGNITGDEFVDIKQTQANE